MKDPFENVDVEARHSMITAGLVLAAMLLGAVLYPRIAIVVAVVLSLLVIITLHEAAHFVTAKRSGMKVTEFFVGFGPRLWSTKRGETEYGIKGVPLGGYCKIIGMTNLDDVPPEDEPRAYRSKAYMPKVVVAGAGSAMHLMLATLLMFVVLAVAGDLGNAYGTSTLDEVSGPAAAAGLKPGDEVVAINGRAVENWDDVPELLQPHAGETVEFTIRRGDDVSDVNVPLATRMVMLGIVAADAPNDSGATIVDVAPGSTAAHAKLAADNVITSFGGTAVHSVDDLTNAVEAHADSKVDIVVDDGGKTKTLHASISALPTAAQLAALDLPLNSGYAGLSPERYVPQLSLFEAATKAPQEVVRVSKTAVGALGHIFSPAGIKEYINNLSGEEESQTRFLSPVGFAQVASDAVDAGWIQVMGLLIAINVFVGLFNLVPLLPFDGGHIAIATYERIASGIRRRRVQVDVAKLLPITAVVMAVLGFIFLSSLFLDITRPVANPF